MGKIRLLLLGDRGVGKTSLLLTCALNRFPVDDDFAKPPYSAPNCVTVKCKHGPILLEDTTGFPENKDGPYTFNERLTIFLLCFSVVKPSSLEYIELELLPEIEKQYPITLSYLVGTQIDLRNDEEILKDLSDLKKEPITFKEGKFMAEKLGAVSYLECSSYTQEGLQYLLDTFDELMRPIQMIPIEVIKRKRKCVIL